MRKSNGQVILPGLAVILVSVMLFMAYVRWAKQSLWQMRMDVAADMTALSAARAEAEMLNYIASTNAGLSAHVQKANIPLLHDAVGFLANESGYEQWHAMLLGEIWGFKTVPAGVGMVVSRLNGAQGRAVYFPFPMDPRLAPQSIHVAIKRPPYYRYLKDAYVARRWSPSKLKAQPPHRTTWIVSRDHIRATATARLWLDVKPSAWENNGGFPRPRERGWRGVLIQSFYPQFNARLLAKARL